MMEMTFKKEEILVMGSDGEFWKASGDLIVNLDKIGDDTYLEGYVPVEVGGGASSIAKVKVPSLKSDLYYTGVPEDADIDNIYVFIHPNIVNIFGDEIYTLDKELVQSTLINLKYNVSHEIPFGFGDMDRFMSIYDLQVNDVRGIIDEKDIRKWQNKVR